MTVDLRKKNGCCEELELEVTNLIGPLKAHPTPFHVSLSTHYLWALQLTDTQKEESHFNQLDSKKWFSRSWVTCLCALLMHGLKLILK